MRKERLIGWTALVATIVGGVFMLWREDSGRALLRRAEQAAPVHDRQLHTCSMHPQVVQVGPGQCPICGMDLTPLPTDLQPQDGVGATGIRVSQGFTQNFGVRTAEAVRGHIGTVIRTVGFLDHNEERVVSVSSKFPGWIERAHVNTIGEQVTAGDVLFEVYSPEVVTAQHEYLSAMGYVERLRASGAQDDALRRANSLLRAAGDRLRYWDLTAGQIARLRSGTGPVRRMEVYAPASGHLIEKADDSLEGMHTTPGMSVLKIADHSTLWARVEFYEHSVKELRPGLRAEITLDAYPGQTWRGEVLFFQPAMNPQSRTLTGFVEVDNPRGLLRPKMYADVRIPLPGVPDAVIVPAESVLRTGDRSVVVIASDDGRFVPREINAGIESAGKVQVLKGVEPGEQVVTSSQFLFDSESNLRTAMTQLLGTGTDSDSPETR